MQKRRIKIEDKASLKQTKAVTDVWKGTKGVGWKRTVSPFTASSSLVTNAALVWSDTSGTNAQTILPRTCW